MAEDLSPFFAGLDSQRVTFKTPKGDRLVQGYFDNAFINADLGEAVLDTTAPPASRAGRPRWPSSKCRPSIEAWTSSSPA